MAVVLVVVVVRVTPIVVIMAALRSRCAHYIFILGFLLLSLFFFLSCFSSLNLSGRRVDVYHTSTYGVALVQI